MASSYLNSFPHALQHFFSFLIAFSILSLILLILDFFFGLWITIQLLRAGGSGVGWVTIPEIEFPSWGFYETGLRVCVIFIDRFLMRKILSFYD